MISHFDSDMQLCESVVLVEASGGVFHLHLTERAGATAVIQHPLDMPYVWRVHGAELPRQAPQGSNLQPTRSDPV